MVIVIIPAKLVVRSARLRLFHLYLSRKSADRSLAKLSSIEIVVCPGLKTRNVLFVRKCARSQKKPLNSSWLKYRMEWVDQKHFRGPLWFASSVSAVVFARPNVRSQEKPLSG